MIKEVARVVLADVVDQQGQQSAQQLREQSGDVVYCHCDVSIKSEVEVLFDLPLTPIIG